MHQSHDKAALPTLLLAVLGLLAGCTSGPASVSRSASTTAPPAQTFPGIPADAAVAVAYPTEIDGFTFGSIAASDDAAAGTRLRYHSDGFSDLILDAFAYMVGFTDQPEAVLVDFERSFAEYMAGAVQQGHYISYTPREAGRMPIRFSFGSREGVWQLFDLRTEQTDLLSLTYLFYRAPFAIKIRASHPPTITPDMLRRHVDYFVEQLVPALVIRNQQGCGSLSPVNVGANPSAAALIEAATQSLVQDAMKGCRDYDQLKQLSENVRSTTPAATPPTRLEPGQ